jgi:hypothetical protein
MSFPVSSRTVVSLAAAVLIGIGGLGSGCDVGFDPFAENERHYSISGYLDVRNDTQFVRVERLRDSLLFDTNLGPATVEMEHLETGQTWTWRDSIFRVDSGLRVHNFWSTAPVQPRQTYRLSVHGPDERRSAATVTLPDIFPTPKLLSYPGCLRPSPIECPGNIHLTISGIRRLVDVTARYHYSVGPPSSRACQGKVAIDDPESIQPVEDEFLVELDWKTIATRLNEESPLDTTITDVELLITAGGPAWPDTATVSEAGDEAPYLSGNQSNVDGGVGFLGGIVTKAVDVYPPQDCMSEGSSLNRSGPRGSTVEGGNASLQ